jgi:hypothetical protein
MKVYSSAQSLVILYTSRANGYGWPEKLMEYIITV